MLFKADVVMLMTSVAQEAFCVWRNRRCENSDVLSAVLAGSSSSDLSVFDFQTVPGEFPCDRFCIPNGMDVMFCTNVFTFLPYELGSDYKKT